MTYFKVLKKSFKLILEVRKLPYLFILPPMVRLCNIYILYRDLNHCICLNLPSTNRYI